MDYEEGQDELLRLPPQAIEAEQSILGALMLDNRQIDGLADSLDARDFYRNDHQTIYKAIIDLDALGEPADVVTVAEKLTANKEIDKCGGLAYLGAIAKNTPNTGNVGAYAKVVRERALFRRVIEAGNDIAAKGYEPEGLSAEEVVSDVETLVAKISRETGNDLPYKPFNQILAASIDRIEEVFHSESSITGLSTGFNDLDELTAGLQDSDLVIVAGRPSMGKTSFSMNLTEHIALQVKKPVGIFSMEMPADQLSTRLLASQARVSMQRLRVGELLEEDWPKLTSAMGRLQDAPFYIDDTPALTSSELRRRAKKMDRDSGGLGAIMVDYLQLMRGTDGDNETEKISYITRALKALAKELSLPIIVLSQLNRSLEQRPNKRPVMSDLRASGAIEQDADLIMFIYRHEIYEPDTDQKGIAEIIIGKQRNGPLGTVRLAFIGEFTRFENYAGPSFNTPLGS